MPGTTPTHQQPLNSTIAITAHTTEKISAWVISVIRAGATKIEHAESRQILSDIAQKIAIIIGESSDEEVTALIELYEKIF
jgi:hypothetical protein